MSFWISSELDSPELERNILGTAELEIDILRVAFSGRTDSDRCILAAGVLERIEEVIDL